MVPDRVMERGERRSTTDRSPSGERRRTRVNGNRSEAARQVEETGVAGPGFMEEMWRGTSPIPDPDTDG